MLTKQILKFTQESHPDYSNLIEVLQKFESINNENN